MRFKHAQRHSFMHEQCTHRTLLWKVIRVKRRGRRAFYIAGPTCAAPGDDVFGRMYDRLAGAIANAGFLVPDFRTPGRGGRRHGQIDLMKHAMAYSKFQSGVCAPSPLLAFLWRRRADILPIPCVANCPAAPIGCSRHLSVGLRLATGWMCSPRAQEDGRPLASRCLSGTPRPDSRHRLPLGGYASRPFGLRTRRATSTMNPYVRLRALRLCASLPLVPKWGRQLVGPGLSPEASSSSSSSSSVSSADSTSVDSEAAGCSLVSQSEVHWLLPSGADSHLHLCRFDPGEEDDLMAVCRHTPFRFGAQRGQGLIDAAQTGRQWSLRCKRSLLRRAGSNCLESFER